MRALIPEDRAVDAFLPAVVDEPSPHKAGVAALSAQHEFVAGDVPDDEQYFLRHNTIDTRHADAARASQRLTNASVRALIATVSITECVVPRGLTADIDTWDDARSHGIAMQGDGQD